MSVSTFSQLSRIFITLHISDKWNCPLLYSGLSITRILTCLQFTVPTILFELRSLTDQENQNRQTRLVYGVENLGFWK